METRKLTKEELLEADAYFNMASLLGKSIQASAHQVMHPEGDPEHIVWLDKPEVSDPGEEPEEEPEEAFEDDTSDDSLIHSNEGSIDHQISQILAMYTPGLYEYIKPSALCEMFHLACTRFNFDLKDSDPNKELSDSDKQKAAIAWIIAKRVFAVRHPDETLLVISFTERLFRESKAVSFRPMDDTDREFVIETCDMLADGLLSDEPIAQALEKISQIPPQDTRYIPLLSKAFREQRAIASRRDFAPVPVGGGATIKARIGREGEGPVELSEFEMLIQQVIGEMIQYRVRLDGEGSLPIRVTPEQIYRWMVNDLTNTLHPSPETRKMIVTAVDKLIQTPAELHILEQLEKHTKLKSKPGYKKLIKNEGKIIGTLITGKHYGASYNGKVLEDTFVIYDMPMFFYYSSFTGQLLKVDSKLITGSTAKTGQQRNTYNDIILHEHILYRVNLIKREKKEKNKKIAQEARRLKKKPKLIENFTKAILLESLAEECDIALTTPKKLEVFRNKVLDYLHELEDQGEIKKSSPKYESRRITGAIITI